MTAERTGADEEVIKIVSELREVLARHGAKETSMNVGYEISNRESSVRISIDAVFLKRKSG